jgi:glycosyltransferase involved in cell wall biosynthesis
VIIDEQPFMVTHVAEDMAAITGGVPAVVYQLSKNLVGCGITNEIVYSCGTLESIYNGVAVYEYPPSRIGRLWFYSHQLRCSLKRLIKPYSGGLARVLHIHGAWSAPQFFSAIYAYKNKTPFIFTAHGMLEPWLWNNQGLWIAIKKRVYWHFFAKAALSRATVIHAITPLEMRHLSKLFPDSRIEVIPNAIDVLDLENLPRKKIRKTILFLGRIESKKGIDILLEAFASADLSAEWSLEIVGPVWSQNYLNSLHKIIEVGNMKARVTFLGPLFGSEKQEKIDTSWVLVAPSYSEVVGLVNLEASSRCVPTITTYQTGLYDWEDGGGILIEPNIGELTEALKNVCAWTLEERVEKGLLSYSLIKSRYSWEVVMKQWTTLYSSIINRECRA